jgi:hypothetical protein
MKVCSSNLSFLGTLSREHELVTYGSLKHGYNTYIYMLHVIESMNCMMISAIFSEDVLYALTIREM